MKILIGLITMWTLTIPLEINSQILYPKDIAVQLTRAMISGDVSKVSELMIAHGSREHYPLSGLKSNAVQGRRERHLLNINTLIGNPFVIDSNPLGVFQKLTRKTQSGDVRRVTISVWILFNRVGKIVDIKTFERYER